MRAPSRGRQRPRRSAPCASGSTPLADGASSRRGKRVSTPWLAGRSCPWGETAAVRRRLGTSGSPGPLLGVAVEIVGRRHQACRRIVEQADADVARDAEKFANPSSRVVVVDVEPGPRSARIGAPTDGAAPPLASQHQVVLPSCEVEAATKPARLLVHLAARRSRPLALDGARFLRVRSAPRALLFCILASLDLAAASGRAVDPHPVPTGLLGWNEPAAGWAYGCWSRIGRANSMPLRSLFSPGTGVRLAVLRAAPLEHAGGAELRRVSSCRPAALRPAASPGRSRRRPRRRAGGGGPGGGTRSRRGGWARRRLARGGDGGAPGVRGWSTRPPPAVNHPHHRAAPTRGSQSTRAGAKKRPSRDDFL